MQTKNFLQSKTIWGTVIMIVSMVLFSTKGITISETEQSEIVTNLVGHVSMITEALGGLLTVYGRLTAKKQLKMI